MIEVALFTVKDVAGTPPKVTLVAPVSSAPISVTEVPPNSVPELGLMLVNAAAVR
ncbi:hypothetical protein D3C72_2405770 [compost metagenome]